MKNDLFNASFDELCKDFARKNKGKVAKKTNDLLFSCNNDDIETTVHNQIANWMISKGYPYFNNMDSYIFFTDDGRNWYKAIPEINKGLFVYKGIFSLNTEEMSNEDLRAVFTPGTVFESVPKKSSINTENTSRYEVINCNHYSNECTSPVFLLKIIDDYHVNANGNLLDLMKKNNQSASSVQILTVDDLCISRDIGPEWFNERDIYIVSSPRKTLTIQPGLHSIVTVVEYKNIDSARNAYRQDIKYWCNSCGELYHPEKYNIMESDLPEELRKAYNDLWTDSSGSYCYLVEYKDRFGVALINEYDDYYSKSINLPMDDLYKGVKKKASELCTMKVFENTIIITTEYQGFNDCHELIVIFPVNTEKNVFKIASEILLKSNWK